MPGNVDDTARPIHEVTGSHERANTAYHKRRNRKNELLADAAEKASVAAEWLGGRLYPLKRLNDAWTLVMGGHFHDNLAGTSTPKAYEFTWNDDVIAMNQFASVLTSATGAVTSALNTRGSGPPIVVYNPLAIAREDVVEAGVSFAGGMPRAVRVFGPDGRAVPAQLSGGKVLFAAKAPSAGYAVYDVRRADSAISASREVNGQEQPLGSATVTRGEIVTNFGAFQPRTFAVKIAAAPAKAAAPQSRPISLTYDLAVASRDNTKSVAGFDAAGRAIPAEMLSTTVDHAGVGFNLASAMEGKPNAVVSRGQTINLGSGKFRACRSTACSRCGIAGSLPRRGQG